MRRVGRVGILVLLAALPVSAQRWHRSAHAIVALAHAAPSQASSALHDFTVFAHVLNGMDVVDAILEGDVIEKVEILT